MLSSEEENKAVQCLYDFIYHFNNKDKSKILNCLHYPHMAQSDNNDPKIYKNQDEMWGYIGFLLNKLEKEENWNKSTLDKVEVINKSDNAVQCLVEFNRRLENNKVMQLQLVFGLQQKEWPLGFANKSNDTHSWKN